MFDSETRWFIRCDTCPDINRVALAGAPDVRGGAVSKDKAKELAVMYGWDVRDGLHRCPDCMAYGRTEMAT